MDSADHGVHDLRNGQIGRINDFGVCRRFHGRVGASFITFVALPELVHHNVNGLIDPFMGQFSLTTASACFEVRFDEELKCSIWEHDRTLVSTFGNHTSLTADFALEFNESFTDNRVRCDNG